MCIYPKHDSHSTSINAWELGDMDFTAKLAHFHAQSARRFRKKIIQVIRLTT